MTHRRAAALLVALLVCVPSVDAQSVPSAPAERITPASLEALHRWVNAANDHVPGRPDPAAAAMAAMTYTARREMNPAYALFKRVLLNERVNVRRGIEESVVAFGKGIRNNPGTRTFLKRAAMVHADAVVFADRFPSPPDAGPSTPQQGSSGDLRRGVHADPPPLLAYFRFPLTRDGQIVGSTVGNWNLPFARSLLVMLLAAGDPAGDRAFVADWYHAVSAFLFAHAMNGDAASHLKESAHVLPDDPHALFDRGTYAEWFGLPIYQAVPGAGVPLEDETNAEAEQAYRRALAIDPAYVEARVRLARLLDHRGRHDDAAQEIDRALDAHPSGVTGFYASIVAGRVAMARGRHADALRYYRDASGFFQNAQSALLGASQAALIAADLPKALTPVQHLNALNDTADPWWDYSLGAGREATVLLEALWASAPRVETAPSVSPQMQMPSPLDALQRWIDAVRTHHPGNPDIAAAHVASWSYAHRIALNPLMERFLTMLRGEPVTIETAQQDAIAALARGVRKDPGVPAFMRRAAMLHTDAGIFADELPEPPDDAPAAPVVDARAAAESMRRGEDAAPLLSTGRYVLHVDGRVTGDKPANWNWGFARRILDEVLLTDRPFAVEWYHAVAAYMLANGRHGDASKHLQRAAMALPDDPHILFDRACLAEALGLPTYQVLPDDPGFRNSSGRFIEVPPEDATDATAESLFRRTLEADPSYAEARVRLGRLLSRRGRHDEASAEVRSALERSPEGVVGFFAHIVGGRVAAAQKRYDVSLRHYGDAVAAFPHAQSALLGASQAALMLADVPQTLAPVGRLGAEAETDGADPWWAYELGPGRDADSLMAHLWARSAQ